ncbi:hypothetical protein AAVH_43095, partial [Aphelenchoides avenae]
RKELDDASNMSRLMKKEDDCVIKRTLDDMPNSKKVKLTRGASNLDLLASVASLRNASVKLEKASSKQRHDVSASDGCTSDANEDVVEHDE